MKRDLFPISQMWQQLQKWQELIHNDFKPNYGLTWLLQLCDFVILPCFVIIYPNLKEQLINKRFLPYVYCNKIFNVNSLSILYNYMFLKIFLQAIGPMCQRED